MSIKYNDKTIAGNYKVSASITASDTNAGPIKIATEQELKDTTNNKVAVTPYLLNKALNSINRGLKIGRIGIGFINESQQQERYLNGQVIIQDQFESFTTWVKDLIKLYPNLSCTNEEFETACSMSAYGQCGRFVVDDNAGSIRLPKVVNVQGLFDLTQAGLTVEAGLPNITTTFTYGNDGTSQSANGALISLSEYTTSSTNTRGSGVYGFRAYKATFDASGSSSIYGNSTTVQQEAVQYPYHIVVATGVDESVDVTREIELNNPYSLGDSKYSPRPLNNSSWLKSAGQWNSKILYPSYYDWILANVNGGVEGFVLATDTYTDYDFVINTADETFRLPLLDGSESLPVGKFKDFTLQQAGYKYIAPANGWVTISKVANASGQQLAIFTRTAITTYSTSSGQGLKITSPLLKRGDSFQIADSTGGALEQFRFVYAQGNGSLYYYVGDTVQNANLINAGRIEEKIASLIPDNSSLISGYAMPSGKYISLTLGSSGATYTAPANGWFFINIAGGSSQYARFQNSENGMAYQYGNNNTNTCSGCIEVKKGDVISVQYNATNSTVTFRFIYAVGSESEAQ